MRILTPGAYHGDGLTACPGLTLSLYGPGAGLPLHAHEEAHLFVIVEGGCRQSGAGPEAILNPGTAVLVPAGAPHTNQFGESGAVCLNLAPPEAPSDGPRLTRLSAPVRAAAARLALRIAAGAPFEHLDLEGLSAEVLSETRQEPPPQVALDRVLDALDEAPEAPWRLADLARLAGRHPTHLARSFRRATGVSISAYRRMRRLRSACLDLRRSRGPLSEIAQRHGYFDQAHLTREFKQAFGISPGAWVARR